jgi:hypothetical protein
MLGASIWPALIRQSLHRLERDRLVNDVGKAVNHDGAIALVNPLEALAEIHNDRPP